MTRQSIYESSSYSIISYGNGFAYSLYDNATPSGRSIFVVGEDAEKFREELNAITDKFCGRQLNGLP